ncbi:MAG: endonuclease [Bacteroidetes bacterium]|nr:MAG: endonuclease [Bacteroidota bacterium]
MKKLVLFGLFLFLFACNKQEQYGITVAFYNVENLFDTLNNPKNYDEEFTPTSDRKWDSQKYETKLSNLAKVISELANDNAPTFLGVCEVENRTVLEDLVHNSQIVDENYGIAHIESPDERGIDVAFLYNQSIFSVSEVKAYQPNLSDYKDKTRDILYVIGNTTSGETLHFLINHWPSRGEGRKKSEPKRIIAANTLTKIIQEIQHKNTSAKIIVMGDFNDEPSNKSISETLAVSCNQNTVKKDQLFNAFCELEDQDYGSYRYRSYWDMLDQIMISKSLITDTSGLHFITNSAAIKAEDWMIQTGKYEGFPLRTYGGNKYLGGYSDHFPVFIELNHN